MVHTRLAFFSHGCSASTTRTGGGFQVRDVKIKDRMRELLKLFKKKQGHKASDQRDARMQFSPCKTVTLRDRCRLEETAFAARLHQPATKGPKNLHCTPCHAPCTYRNKTASRASPWPQNWHAVLCCERNSKAAYACSSRHLSWPDKLHVFEHRDKM